MRYKSQWLGRETTKHIATSKAPETSKAPVANHNGLDAKLLRSSWKTTKAWVANHNGLDAKLLRSSWKTTKAWVANHNGLGAKLLRMSLKINAGSKFKKRRRYCFFYSLKHFLSSFAAEPIRIAKSSLVAFERILSSFAAKPIRNATPCLVAFEHMLSSFAAKPIRIANLTLLPRDVCGYARANMAPLPRNQRCHSQKLVLLPFLV